MYRALWMIREVAFFPATDWDVGFAMGLSAGLGLEGWERTYVANIARARKRGISA